MTYKPPRRHQDQPELQRIVLLKNGYLGVMTASNMRQLPAWANPVIGSGPTRVRVLHLAEGVLVGLRRRPPEDVLAELVNTARRAGLSPYVVAAALLKVASGQCPEDLSDPAIAVVHEAWGSLLGLQPSATH